MTARRVGRFAQENPLLTSFIALALITRLIFWFYTGRIWEDALIGITAARNVWEGFGLTHHPSEPRIQVFTSPIGVLIAMIGEAFHAGLLAVRLCSLGSAVASIYFAYRIGLFLAYHWAAHVLVLTYLACDQLQIFFGMAGMETQMVTAIALATLYFYLVRRWLALGIACGLATVARPEFVLFVLPCVGLPLVAFHPRAIGRVAPPAAAIAAAWYGFAQLYYGSVIPNTIVAKSLSMRAGLFSAPWRWVWDYTKNSWCDYVPFKEFWVARSFSAPLPDLVLKAVLFAVVALFVVGLVVGAARRSGILIAAAAVVGFVAYRNAIILNSYYMWYLPPFVALAFVVVGYGLSQCAVYVPVFSSCLGPLLGLSYACHMPFSFPLDKKVQTNIEVAVRERVGRTLAAMMGPNDSVVLEPLGFMGWAALNKTVYDFPGLGSKVSVRAVKQLPVPGVAGLIDALQPTYAVVRPNEFDDLERGFPLTNAKYEEAAHIRAKRNLRLRHGGYEYAVMDNDFRILRRRDERLSPSKL